MFWASVYQANRRTEIVLCRLRIGHTQLTNNILLEGSDAPVCDHCGVSLSIGHILVHCRRYNATRQKWRLEGKPIQYILSDDADVDSIMGFLKEIDIYYNI